ncbi:MAG: hypothetical protein LH606_05630 [Cytophagaceae bacterium]|nr:hypothetical protein [Cytophagaceae bacterium]
MSRSTFILLLSIYGFLLAAGMLFAPAALLAGYGQPRVDNTHVAIFQFLGIANLGLNIIGLLVRNAEPSPGLRAYLAGTTITLFGGVVLGVYHVLAGIAPADPTFLIDTGWRFLLGVGAGYYLVKLNDPARAAAAR